VDSSPARLVREFHERFDLARADLPGPVSAECAEVRIRLLAEEVAELFEAMSEGNLPDIARELADVVYVAYGTAVAYGIDLDGVLAEVHRANMSKLGPADTPVITDGKVQKGPHFQPPDVAAVLARQTAQPHHTRNLP
jgi:predicted HAD superfamily Cof-like phosphohydrolase